MPKTVVMRVTSVSTDNLNNNAGQTGGLMGGNQVFIKGTDFKSTDQIEVTIGGNVCELNSNLTNDLCIVCWVPPSTSGVNNTAAIMIRVNMIPADCHPNLCRFYYREDRTP